MENNEHLSYVVVKVDGKSRLRSRVVMENLLGRPLKREEIVHHIDGNRGDDRPENLRLLPSQGEHKRLHAEIRRLNPRPKKARPLPPDLQYLTIKDAMQMLHLSRATAYGYISSGRLKSYKVGHLVRIREIDLKNFIEGKPSKKNKKRRSL